MYYMLESQRIVYYLLSAFMPKTAQKGLCYLGITEAIDHEDLAWGGLKAGGTIAKAEALFPRIEEKVG